MEMGASWLEVDKLIREVDSLAEFPHAEALAPVVRARDVVAETAMVVSLAGLSDDTRAETEAHDLLARARVAVLDAQLAVRRAQETVALARSGGERAARLMAEARALRARDRTRVTLTPVAGPPAPSPPAVTALVRVEPAAS
jgi:hypothetical protein